MLAAARLRFTRTRHSALMNIILRVAMLNIRARHALQPPFTLRFDYASPPDALRHAFQMLRRRCRA